MSVIIPTYNCAACLPAALESVFQQTLKNFEVIVVDDGSIDNTEAAIAPWRDRVIYLKQSHAGVSAARNAAIGASSAPYIAFLDADDRWMPAKLERQVAMMESDPRAGMSCTDFSIVYSDGECVESFHRRSSPLASGDLFTRIVEHSFAASCTVMIRREVLRQSDVFDPAFTVCEDWNLWLRIAHDHPVAIIPEVLCVVHAKRTQDANARPYELTRTAEIAALRNVLAAFPAMTPPRRHSVLRQIGRLKYEFGKYLLLQNQAQRSRENLRGAFRAYPVRASLLWLFSFASKNFFQGAVRLKRGVAAYR